jgi:hypothetical protein
MTEPVAYVLPPAYLSPLPAAPPLADPPEPVAPSEPVNFAAVDEDPPAPAVTAQDRITLLFAERDRLAENRQRYVKVSTRHSAALAALAEVDKAIGVVDAAEAEEWRTWASNPDGEQPKSMRAERRKLAQRRDAALDEIDVARRAEASIMPLIRQLDAEMAQITRQVFELHLTIAVERARDLHAEAVKAAAEVAATMTPIVALRRYLAEEIGAAQLRDDRPRWEALSAANQAIADLEAPLVKADGATVARELDAWRAAMR